MNTMQDYSQSSWGRILLLLKVDYHSYRRNLFIGLGLIVLFFNFLARMGMLFDSDISTSWFTSFDVNSRFVLIWPAILIAFTIYINKRCQHSKPIAFSLMPTNLWEKAVAMLLGVLAINVLAFVTTYLTVIIDWLFAPKLVSLAISFKLISFSFEHLTVTTGVSTFSLIFFLTVCIQLVQHKSYFKAVFLGCLYYFSVWIITFRVFVYGIESLITDKALSEKVARFIEGNYEAMDMMGYTLILIFIAIDVLLGAYLYTRLKKLEV